MKYLIKSNLLVIVSAFAFPFIYFTITFKEYSYTQALMIIIAIFEAILVKSNYDFINYDHDFKYHIHQLPKWLFYMMNILFSNGYHIIFNKSKYTLPLLSISINAPLCIVGYSSVYFIILGISIIYSIALAYYLSHLKTKVYTYDNY